MPVLYPFVGPETLKPLAMAGIARCRMTVDTHRDQLFRSLEMEGHDVDDPTFAYIVDVSGALWLADRHCEHVACARGGHVMAAGEITFDFSGKRPEVIYSSNQSTGYCPCAACWAGLAQALDALGIDRTDGFDAAFEFGLCRGCASIAIVKESIMDCVECGGVLGAVHP